MTNPSDKQQRAVSPDALAFLKANVQRTVQIGVAATVLAAVALGLYVFVIAPQRRTFLLEFRPTFNGADSEQYPNGLPFSPNDIIAAHVLDAVFEHNKIQDYCARDDFRTGFLVDRRSSVGAMLDAEFSANMAEPRLTAADRERLTTDYQSRRKALPVEFRLMFVVPSECRSLPRAVGIKVVADTLGEWARSSAESRGVLRLPVEILTPEAFDAAPVQGTSSLVRADLVRASLARLRSNISAVEELPGASVVRLEADRRSFAQIRSSVDDLLRGGADSLLGVAESAADARALNWAVIARAGADRDYQAALERASAFEKALLQYVGASGAGVEPDGKAPAVSGEVMPQIDRTFLDRILELADRNNLINIQYRQRLTQAGIDARLEAVLAGDRADYYQDMVARLERGSRGGTIPADFDSRLGDVIAQGKALAKTFNDLVDQFRLASTGAESSLYLAQPAYVESARVVGWLPFFQILAGTFVAIVLALLSLGYIRLLLRPTSDADAV